jgi:leucyl/phenylalanyl-tRNA--protein transferase
MLFLLDPHDPAAPFPDVQLAEQEPNGLLAVGGDLSITRLVNAYRRGIFPWFSRGDPILWWAPDPRTVLYPGRIRVTRSLRKTMRKRTLGVTLDEAFDAVIQACSEPRPGSSGTWLVPEMITAYRRLHRQGLAHSVEVWQGGDLVGGLYGVAIGRVFFGESMFSRVSDASKIALVHLCRTLENWRFRLIDCQVLTSHLIRMGAEEIPRKAFVQLLASACLEPGREGPWRQGDPVFPDAGPQLPPGAQGPNPGYGST